MHSNGRMLWIIARGRLMNMAIAHGFIVIERPGRRSIPIQPMNERIYFEALRSFGVGEVMALAATKGLITLKLRAK